MYMRSSSPPLSSSFVPATRAYAHAHYCPPSFFLLPCTWSHPFYLAVFKIDLYTSVLINKLINKLHFIITGGPSPCCSNTEPSQLAIQELCNLAYIIYLNLYVVVVVVLDYYNQHYTVLSIINITDLSNHYN